MVVICSPARLAARRAGDLWHSPAGLLSEPLLYHANGMDNWGSWFEAAGVRRDTLTLANGFDQASIPAARRHSRPLGCRSSGSGNGPRGPSESGW